MVVLLAQGVALHGRPSRGTWEDFPLWVSGSSDLESWSWINVSALLGKV